MRGSEFGVMACDVTAGLTDDFQVSDDCILDDVTAQKARDIQAITITIDAVNGLNNVIQVVWQARCIASAHMGRA